jgi:hypothetical protein
VTNEVPDFTLSQLCWLLDCTKPRITQLEEADIVAKTARDKYAAASVRNFVRFQRKDGGGSKQMQDAKLEALTQKIAMSKMDLDERRSKLWPAEAVTFTWRDIFVLLRQHLLSLPSKLAPRLLNKTQAAEVETILRAHIYEALENLPEKVEIRKATKKELANDKGY